MVETPKGTVRAVLQAVISGHGIGDNHNCGCIMASSVHYSILAYMLELPLLALHVCCLCMLACLPCTYHAMPCCIHLSIKACNKCQAAT